MTDPLSPNPYGNIGFTTFGDTENTAKSTLALALAYEQRTANLLAASAVLHEVDDHARARTLRREALTRLGHGPKTDDKD